MLHFYGFRKEFETLVFRSYNDRVVRLPLYLDEVNHSPTGFEWGYGGSGPAQLSYAILRSYFATRHPAKEAIRLARLYYQDFKWETIAKFSKDNFKLAQSDIDIWFKTRLTDSAYHGIIEVE